jgi:5-(aminomethyl)-3-furanmethanol phosphate kinase
MPDGPTVIKVGGSLFDWPELIPTLKRFLASFRLPILVPGGGPAADMIRNVDATHGLGADASHWLAIRAMELNGRWLSRLLNSSRGQPGGAEPAGDEMPDDLPGCRREWNAGRVPVIDAWAFCRGDESRAEALPHDWSVTSDAIAARVAECLGAQDVWFLKSTDAGSLMGLRNLALCGLIDSTVPIIAERRLRAGTPICVRVLNLRSWSCLAAGSILPVELHVADR